MQTVTGSALGGGSTVTTTGKSAPNLGVTSSSVVARARLDKVKGAVTNVTATVHGVSLLDGAVRIGELTTSVEAHAHGRPGTAGSIFHRVLQDVRLGSRLLCASSCNASNVASAINATFPGQLRVDFPTPDAGLANGSPGGYQAVVKREQVQQIQEVQLNEQSADRVEVPGMVVTVFEDNYVPSRTIAYLGGVEAEAYYGIYLLGANSNSGAPNLGQGPTAPKSMASRVSATLQHAAQGGAAPQPPAVATGPQQLLPSIGHGLRVLANSIARVFRLFGVWLLLLVPVYLGARRWALLSRGMFYGGPR
jgi:hypothetical protein